MGFCSTKPKLGCKYAIIAVAKIVPPINTSLVPKVKIVIAIYLIQPVVSFLTIFNFWGSQIF